MTARLTFALGAALLVCAGSRPAFAYSCGLGRPALFEIPAAGAPTLDDIMADFYVRNLAVIHRPSGYAPIDLSAVPADPHSCSMKKIAGLWIPDVEFVGVFTGTTAVLTHTMRWAPTAYLDGILDLLVQGDPLAAGTLLPWDGVWAWGDPAACTLPIDGVTRYFYKLCLAQ